MKKVSLFLFVINLLSAVGANAQQDSSANKQPTAVKQAQEIEAIRQQVQAHTDSARLEAQIADTAKRAEYNPEKKIIATSIAILTSRPMHGRGYVMNGRDSAAIYILRKFREFRLVPLSKDHTYTQGYAFPVNTFPGKMDLTLNDEKLTPGAQFLIDPASNSFKKQNMEVRKVNLDKISGKSGWKEQVATLDTNHAWYFENVDSFCANVLKIRRSHFIDELPAGCYIAPEAGKPMWSVSREAAAATLFYVRADLLPKKLKKVSANVNSLYLTRARSENIMAYMPGDVKDTFIVFSAHYDHLGMMGENTEFPGASDNASGTALLLYLAYYFSTHPQHYSIAFIAFSGEEAALKGSEFFTQHPAIPLKNIKFLTNLDIMGDATNGVTVVNATEYPKEFNMLQSINERNKYVPAINVRGKAANSDHYYFTEAGVPSFFMYSVGGKGYYHDIFDRAKEITLKNIDGAARLLIDFVQELR